MSSPEPVPTTPDGTTASTNPTTEPAHRGVEAWIGRHKIALSGCFAIGFTGGFAGPSAWDWYLRQDITPGHGTIIGGFFVVTAAAIAYTGTHLTRTSTERIAIAKNDLDTTNAERAHNLADIQELRRRFVTTTAQFADPSPEVRLAGVYALEALTNDWIDRDQPDDAQTCINYLCGYLTRPYTPPTEHPHLRQTVVTPDIGTHVQRTYVHPYDDLHVRHAINRTIARHLQTDTRHDWSEYDYDFTGAHLHNADFRNCHFRKVTIFTNVHFEGDQAWFSGTHFLGQETMFDGARFHCSQTSFTRADFQNELTSFANARFYSERTSFGADFDCEAIWFMEAEFHGRETKFDRARFLGGTLVFDGAMFLSKQTSFDNVIFRSDDWTSFSDTWFNCRDALTFHGAEFHKRSDFNGTEFRGGWTSFNDAELHGKTTFTVAQFGSQLTTFQRTKFRGTYIAFWKARFFGATTSFEGARFAGGRTSFEGPAEWKNVYFDWDPEIPYAVRATKPDSVTPNDWPPTVVQDN